MRSFYLALVLNLCVAMFVVSAGAKASPDDELLSALVKLEKTIRYAATEVPSVVDTMQRPPFNRVRRHFAAGCYDPLNNHWFIADTFLAMAEALQQEKSPRRYQMIWAAMASLLDRISLYATALQLEGEQPLNLRRMSEPHRQIFFERAEAAFHSVSKLLVSHTERLNRSYYNANREVFDTLASRFAIDDLEMSYREYFTLTNSSPERSSPVPALDQTLIEVGMTPRYGFSRDGLRRLGLLLLVSFSNQLPKDKVPTVESFFASVLTDEGSRTNDRALASYGLSLLGKSDDAYLTSTNEALTVLQRKGEQYHPYADLCRQSLNKMMERRLKQSSDSRAVLASIIKLFENSKNSSLEYFLTVPVVKKLCISTILAAGKGKKAR